MKIWRTFYTSFFEHRLLENASSLSFYTLLSIVPILAVLFGIAKGFGIDALLEREVINAVPNQEALAEQVIQFSRKMLEQSRGGLIAGAGILMLLWSFLGLLANFEKALNDIWNVKEGRSYSRRLGDFLGFIFLFPFILVAISSTILFVSTELIDFFQSRGIIEPYGPYLSLTFQLFPLGITFLVFNFFYLYLPNTSVPLRSSFLASLVATVGFHLAQWVFVKFQVGISNYGAVYGSFAAIPLFLLWLQMSWLITLLGGELAYQFTKKK